MGRAVQKRWKLVDSNGFDFGFYQFHHEAERDRRAFSLLLTVYRLDYDWHLYDPSVYHADETPPHLAEHRRKGGKPALLPPIGGCYVPSRMSRRDVV